MPPDLNSLEGADIICIASANWDAELWTNSQHIMSRLAKRNRVLFVESLGLRTPTARWHDINRIVGRLVNWSRGVQNKEVNLYVYSPVVIPLYKIPLVRRFNDWLLRRRLNRISTKLGFRSPILWTFLPTSRGLVGHLGEGLCIYHCVDEYGANPGVPARTIHELERDLLTRADLVLTTSKGLYESKRAHNSNTFYLPNVADYHHFRKAAEPETIIPADIRDLPGPVVGFVGAISGYKIDFKLLLHVARAHPEWSLVLIGPIWPGDKADLLNELQQFKNVHFMGTKRYADLPGYLKSFDVCIIPFELNETTVNVFPMKFHEYMATGKPIVVVDLPSVLEFRDFCRMASGYDEFAEAIEESIASDAKPGEEALLVAKQNTWEARIEHISDLVRDTRRGLRSGRTSRRRMARIGIDIRKIHDFGIGRYIRNLVAGLAEIDPDREYVTFQDRSGKMVGGVNFTPVINSSPKYSVRELISLPRQMKRFEIDLFHSPHYVLPVMRPCPAVVTIHDLIHLFYPPSPAAKAYAKTMMFAATRSAAKVITVSHASRDDIVRELGVDPRKIDVIYNAVDDRFRPMSHDVAREEVARQFGIEEEYILCVSNFLPHKNISRLIQAFSQVRKAGFSGKLVLAGSDVKGRPALLQKVKQLGLDGSVHFPGFVTDQTLPALYSSCRIFAFPSLYEGFGLPPLEAMACGRPVVTSDTPSMNEVVGDAGVRVDPKRPESIAEGICSLLEDDERHAHFVRAGLERAQDFSWSVTARLTLETYREVLNG